MTAGCWPTSPASYPSFAASLLPSSAICLRFWMHLLSHLCQVSLRCRQQRWQQNFAHFFDAQPMPDDALTDLLADDLVRARGFSSSLPDSLPGPSRKPLLAHLSKASTTDIDHDSDCATTLADDNPEPSRRLLRARTTDSSHGSSSPVFRPRKAARR